MDMVKDYMTEIGLKVEGEELERETIWSNYPEEVKLKDEDQFIVMQSLGHSCFRHQAMNTNQICS